MKSLESYTTQELVNALKGRKEKDAMRLLERPQFLANPDFTSLQKIRQSAIDELAETKVWDEDNCQYIYEAAMIACFGPEVFKWISAITSDNATIT